MTKIALQQVVARSNYFVDVLKTFGLENKGSNYRTLKRRLIEDNISFQHIVDNIKIKKGGVIAKKDCDVFVANSSYDRKSIKKRILKQKLLPEFCQICGQQPYHRGSKLVLILDHINGIPNDHRIENLRFVCPNCNSQLSTFAGRHIKKKVLHFCNVCGEQIQKVSKRCIKCSNIQGRKFEVSKEELEELVWKYPTTEVAKMFGVSDKAIEKRCKIFGISKPPLGFWSKLRNGKYLPSVIYKFI